MAVWRRKWDDPNTQKNGRSGQKQHGVDIFGRPQGKSGWEGVQCKAKSRGELKESEVAAEVKKAEGFKPRLERLTIATTLPRNARDQAIVRKISEAQNSRGSFSVSLYSWADITEEIEKYPDLLPRFFPAYSTGVGPRFYGLPQRPKSRCFGRDHELAKLHEQLAPESEALSPAVAMYGAGGIGKTRIALEYALDQVHSYPGGVMWVQVAEKDPIAVWETLARTRFGLELGSPANDQSAVIHLFDYLQDLKGKVLIILDDLGGDHQRFAGTLELNGGSYPALPAAHNLRILITTRFSDLAIARSISIVRLNVDSGIDLFRHHSGRKEEASDIEALVDTDLGGHPLGISLASAYLKRVRGLTVAEYRKRLARRGLTDQLEIAAKHAGKIIVDHERSIVATFKLSVELLETDDPVDALAFRVLGLASFFAPDTSLDFEILDQALTEMSIDKEEDFLQLSLSRLEEISLLGEELRIHTLVADFVQWDQRNDEARRACSALLKVTNRFFPERLEKDIWKIFVSGGDGDYPELTIERTAHITSFNRNANRVAQTGKFSPRWLLRLAKSQENLGFALLKRGLHKSARSEFEGQEDKYQRLAKKNPRKLEWVEGLRTSSRNIGSSLSAEGSAADIAENLKKGFALAKKATSLRKKPNKGRRKGARIAPSSKPSRKILDVEEANAQAKIARDALRNEVIKEFEKEPSLRSETTLVNAPKLYQMARAFEQAGDLSDLEQAAAIYERLNTLDPRNLEWAWNLALCSKKLASIFRGGKLGSRARKEAIRAKKILEIITQAAPEYAEWKIELARTYLDLYKSEYEQQDTSQKTKNSLLSKGLEILESLEKEGRIGNSKTLLDTFKLFSKYRR